MNKQEAIAAFTTIVRDHIEEDLYMEEDFVCKLIGEKMPFTAKFVTRQTETCGMEIEGGSFIFEISKVQGNPFYLSVNVPYTSYEGYYWDDLEIYEVTPKQQTVYD